MNQLIVTGCMQIGSASLTSQFRSDIIWFRTMSPRASRGRKKIIIPSQEALGKKPENTGQYSGKLNYISGDRRPVTTTTDPNWSVFLQHDTLHI